MGMSCGGASTGLGVRVYGLYSQLHPELGKRSTFSEVAPDVGIPKFHGPTVRTWFSKVLETLLKSVGAGSI